MKKSKIVTTIVASVISVSTFSTVLAGCGDKEPYIFEYEVSVIGGTGSGTYKDGSDCSVTAEIPEGKKFDKWVNEFGEVLSIANPYTFKVDGDMEVYAVVSNMQTYKVEIIGGTITGTSDYDVTVYAGDEVSVTANSSNSHKFKEWLINGTETSTANPYKFTATRDMKIEAVVDESYLVAVSGGTIGDTEETRKIYEAGEECTITAGQAPAAGMEFVYWYVLDENGNEKFLTSDTSYTFTVTGTDKYYAKFGVKRTVTVEGGIIEGYPGLTTVSVLDGTSLTVNLDTENIPQGKGFNGWKIGDKMVSKDLSLRLTDITENLVVSADFADKVKYDTPDMSANQVFRKRMSGGNENDYCLELDRGATSVFSENTDYALLYIYETPFADKQDWVGQIRIQNVDGAWQLVTKDGDKLWGIEGSPGNMWIDTKDKFNEGKGHRGNTMDMFKRAIECCGNEYGDDQPYYLAAQIVAKPYSLSADSDISVIGPQSFIKNDVAKRTVTVTGGKIKGTELSQATLFEGQRVTIVPAIDNFKYWRINGEIAEGAEQTVTVGKESLNIVAVPDTMFSATVNGGQIITEGIDANEIEAGVVITVRADDPANGTRFAGWYMTVDGKEQKISDNRECDITVTANIIVTAKYINVYTVTVTNGLVRGMDKTADGKYIVDEGASVVIVPDWANIPADKAFAGWKMGSETTLTYWFKLSGINGDVTVAGIYEATAKLATPMNDNNEMFKVLPNGIIEIDRRNTKVESEFENPEVDFITFYFYNFTFVDNTAENAVGSIRLERVVDGNNESFCFKTKDGTLLWKAKGKKSDLYHDNAAEAGAGAGVTYADLSEVLFALVKGAVGAENFNPNTPYYIAVQAGSNDERYTASEISAIGPQAFIKTAPAQHTVKITDGTIKGTNLKEVTVYKGQKLTIIPDDEETFGGWMINDNFVSATEYEVTVNGDTVITVRDKDAEVTKHIVTVEGGTVGGVTELEVEFGAQVTVTATVPENKAFLYWYVMNGDQEEKVSEELAYTFEVSKDITLIAKFINTYTLTVNGGTVTGDVENGIVKEGAKVKIALDLSKIPEGKGFTNWKIGDDQTQTAYEIELTITANTTVEAVYADKVSEFTKPVNDNNQMFRIGGNGAIEIDRKNKGVESEFDNPNIDHIKFYFYNFAFVANTTENALGYVKLQREVSNGSESFYFVTMGGEKLWSVKGKKSDLYHDNPGEASNSIGAPGKYASISDMIFALVKGAAGEENFNPNTPYYIAVQACGKEGSIYNPSEISAIGPYAFIQNNVAKHTVTIQDGTVSGTDLTSVTVYAGQKLTITTDNADFRFWLVNGEKFMEATVEITVNADVTARAITQDAFNVSVEGGTFKGGTDTVKEVIPGDRYTIVAATPEAGKAFAYWYILGENGVENKVSTDAEFTFTAEAAVTYHAKFVNAYTLTVTGGLVTGDVDENGIVKEDAKVKITLDLSKIPAGQGFTHWVVNGEEKTDFEFELTITANTTVEAVYADKVSVFTTPTMSAGKEMLRRKDDYALELDRNKEADGTTKKTAFVENVEYVKFYIYTTTFADKADFVGTFKLDKQGDTFRLATMSGEKLWNLEGSAGNIWLDTKDGYGINRKGNFFGMMQKILGEKFDANTPYYFAAQVCGKEGSIYSPSEISEIGPQVFIQNNVAAYTVNITGGTFKGTAVSTATLYENQQVTIVPADTENFGGWIVNGSEKVTTSEYTFTVSSAMTISAYSNKVYTVTVVDATATEEISARQVNGGEKITLTVADPAEGKTYGWYKTVDGQEVMILKGNSVEFYITEDITLTAKVLKLAAPINDSDKMFYFANDTCIELDRNKEADGTTKKTAFVENVDYVKFYIYSSREAGAQPIGYMILDKKGTGTGGVFRLATEEGATLINLKSSAGNLYLDGISKEAVRNAFKTALGESVYNEATNLYVAAQACSYNTEYEASELSAIGTVDFKA